MKPSPPSPANHERFRIDGSIILMATIMFLATLRGDRVSDRWIAEKVVLSGPLEMLRNQSLLIIGVLLLGLAILNLRLIVKGRLTCSFAVIALLFLNCGLMFRDYSVKYILAQDMLLGVGAYGVMALCFGITVRRSPADAADRCMLTLMLAFIPFAIASIFETFKNTNNVMWNGRFNGATSHPVFCGVISGLASVAAAHLLLSRMRGKGMWLLSAATLLVGLIFVIVSGTRTGLVVIAVASTGVMWEHFRERRGVWIGAVAIMLAGISAYTAFKILGVEEMGEDARIASLENTRAEAWQGLWEIFIQNPGVGMPGVGGESSYLLAAASGGIVGLLPFGTAIVFFVFSIWSVASFARRFSSGASLASLGVGLLFLGLFEGYMFDVITYPFVTLLLVGASLSSADTRMPFPYRLAQPVNAGGCVR